MPAARGQEPATPPGAPLPSLSDILEALSATGIHEQPPGAAAGTWEPSAPGRTRFLGALIALTGLLIAVGAGGFWYVRKNRAEKAQQASVLGDKVEGMLKRGLISDLPEIESKLSTAFDLAPNSPRTAKLWVFDRVVRSIQGGAEEIGIDSAVNRALEARVEEHELIFAKIASFLSQGDIAGGAALIQAGDKVAARDPLFQWVVGVTLERAGDRRAIERYELSARLDPEFFAPQMMLARGLMLEDEVPQGGDIAHRIAQKWPNRIETSALLALANLRDREHFPAPSSGPPSDIAQLSSRSGELPMSLRAIPAAMEASEAFTKGDIPRSKGAIERGLPACNSPSMATWLGTMALQIGDDVTARRAALQAVSYTALYPRARALAARVALLQGRLDEALQAISELDQSLPEAVLVRAIVAYERGDRDTLGLSLDALPATTRKGPMFAAMNAATAVIDGASLDPHALKDISAADTPWGEIVLADVALDRGNVSTARDLLEGASGGRNKGARAVRWARVLRYTDRITEADVESAQALTAMPTLRTLLERLRFLISAGRGEDARPMLARHANLLGLTTGWALAYVDASTGKPVEGRARLALLEPPPDTSPLPLRMISLSATCELMDKKRCGEQLRRLPRWTLGNPEVVRAVALSRGVPPPPQRP